MGAPAQRSFIAVCLILFAVVCFAVIPNRSHVPGALAVDAAKAGATLSPPTVDCNTSDQGGATVTFHWKPVPTATKQWVDVSVYDNGFVPGTFFTSAPLQPNQTLLVRPGLLTNVAWYWRVNTSTPSGWVASETRVFVTCGATELRSIASCGQDAPTLDFSWALAPLPIREQWIDISPFDNGFVPGTFTSIQLDPTASSFHWPDLPPDTLVWRLNTRTSRGWMTSEAEPVSACADPDTLYPRYGCFGSNAVVEFRWTPITNAQAQWFDFSLNLDGFPAGGFSTNPIAPHAQAFLQAGLPANATVYYRVNVKTASGFTASITRSFKPVCSAPQ